MKKSVSSRQTLAAELLDRFLTSGVMDADALARELVVSVDVVADYRDGSRLIPLERQVCLALLVLEKLPRYARSARRLRDQARGIAAFEASDTEVHVEDRRIHWH